MRGYALSIDRDPSPVVASRSHPLPQGERGRGVRGTTTCCYRERPRRVELPQFFSDDQTLRERRKQSTGVDDPSASKRCSSTPLHWKPHFSRMLREDGLVTRAPEIRCSTSNSSKVKSIAARAASVPNPWPQCSNPSQYPSSGASGSRQSMPTTPIGTKLFSIRNTVSRLPPAVPRTNSIAWSSE